MQLKKFLLFAACCALTAACSRPFVLAKAVPIDDLQSVLARMDAAAAKFHTTSADVEFTSAQTVPIPDTDVQKGTVYYKREAGSFQGGVHIDTDDGQASPKIVVCCAGGLIKMYEKLTNHLYNLSSLSQYQDWFLLGFGASGKELAAKWDMKYDGPETVDGVKTEKLELVSKDAKVAEKVHKVILWMDADRAISVKQYFDEGGGESRTCHYTNIKVNQSLPKDAFTLPTNKETTVTNK